ncbi:hypothetical protein FCJ47_22185, partial [Salmonella enterica]|nr:hypothetical protein [Salmonella enterica]
TIQLIHTVHTVQILHTLSLFSRSDPKTPGSGSDGNSPARSGPLTQDVAVLSAAGDAICCVTALPP